jgi:phage terminase large subunit-like protein
VSLYRQPGMLMFWSHEPVAPWQTEAWLIQMREQLRRNAFLRMIENRFVTSESDFLDMTWWDECVDAGCSPVLKDWKLSVWCGVDASVKKDSAAIVACTFEKETKRVRLVAHRIFQPSKTDPLDFENTIEATLLDWQDRFDVKAVRFDPYQMVASAQRLQKAGVPMVEFPQSVPNLTEASQNLYDLVKGRNLVMYPDAEMRLAASRAVAKETARGWRIAKEKQSHKIDVIVALAQAALGAVKAPALEWAVF